MSDAAKFGICVLVLIAIGIPFMYNKYMESVKFSAQGTVTFINWRSRNHAMPVIEIRSKNGTTTKFSSNRITLKPEQLKVGDSFKKTSGSKSCQINGNIVQCIN